MPVDQDGGDVGFGGRVGAVPDFGASHLGGLEAALAEPDAQPALEVFLAATMRQSSGARTALHAELGVSELLGLMALMAPPGTSSAELDDVADLILITGTEGFATAAGVALLRAWAAIGPPATRDRAHRTAEALIAGGLPDPVWSAAVGRPLPGTCWRHTYAGGHLNAITLTFSYADGAHAVTVLTDDRCDGIKDVWVSDDVPALLADTQALVQVQPGSSFRFVDPGYAAAQVRTAQNAEPCPEVECQEVNLALTGRLLDARLDLLQAHD